MQNEIFEEMLSNLEKKNLIKYFNTSKIKEGINSKLLLKLAEEPQEIFVHDNNLCYHDENGDVVCCPEIDARVSDAGYWLSDKILAPIFDLSQSGNIRKAGEAESSYICCTICGILNDETFTNEFSTFVRNYDFEKMISIDGERTFNSLLNDWLSLQSIIINVIVSASRYAISSQKKDTEQFLKNGLTNEQQDGLRDLALSIKSINFKYSTEDLSPQSVKKLTKIDVLKLIEKRNREINVKIVGSKYGDLYKTLRLSTEYVSPIIKKKISQWAGLEVDRLYKENESISKNFGDKISLIQKLRLRAYRYARDSVRRENVLKYIENPEMYTLPRKA